MGIVLSVTVVVLSRPKVLARHMGAFGVPLSPPGRVRERLTVHSEFSG